MGGEEGGHGLELPRPLDVALAGVEAGGDEGGREEEGEELPHASWHHRLACNETQVKLLWLFNKVFLLFNKFRLLSWNYFCVSAINLSI